MQTNLLQRLKRSLGRFGKMIEWIKGLFYNEYEVTVWHSSTPHKKAVFILSSITKKSNTKIEGLDQKKKPFEYSSPEPFHYQIRKLY